MHLDVSQLEQLGRDIHHAGGTVGAKGSAVFRKTVHDMEGSMKEYAAVDTGAMRNSVSSILSGDGRFSTMTAEIGPTVDYGIWQEIGTSRMPAHPFVAPGFDRHIDPFTEALARIGAEIL